MKKLSKIFAVALCLVMVLSMLPAASAASNWQEVAIGNIAATDMVAIVYTKAGADYVMLNDDDQGPLANFDKDSTAATAAMLWNISATTGGYHIKPMDAATYLSVMNDNNGLQIVDTACVWKLNTYKETNLYLAASDGTYERVVGVYNTNNFRSYKANGTGDNAPHSNLKDQTVKFYKWTGAKPGAAQVTTGTVAEALAAENNTLWKITATVVMNVDGKNVYVQDETGAIDLYFGSTMDLKPGDKITATGKKTVYNGLPELTNAALEGTATAGTAPTPVTKKIGELTAADICTLVKITGLTVTKIGNGDTPDVTLTDGTDTIKIYRALLPADLAVDSIVDVTAAVARFNEDYQLRVDESTDIVITGVKGPEEFGDATDLVVMPIVLVLSATALVALIIGNKKRMF